MLALLASVAAVTLGLPTAMHATASAAEADPTSARAGTTGDVVTLTTRDVATYPDGGTYATFVVTAERDASESGTWSGRWSADVEIIDPDGASTWDYHDGTATSRTMRTYLCRMCGDPTGTYHVHVSWTQYDADDAAVAEGETSGAFRYTIKPRVSTRLTVTKDAYGVNGWRFAGRLTRAGKPFADQRVHLWVRLDGSWYDFDETKRTGDRGRVAWHTARRIPRNTYVWQLRYDGNDTSRPTRSDTFRLPRR